MTLVKVANGQAVNHNGQYLEAGSLPSVEDRLAVKWIERRFVLPAKAPATKASKRS